MEAKERIKQLRENEVTLKVKNGNLVQMLQDIQKQINDNNIGIIGVRARIDEREMELNKEKPDKDK